MLIAEPDGEDASATKPIDARGSSFVYYAFLLCGAGFLFPFNSFISAVDYFETAYLGSDLTFWFSVSYLWSTLAALFLNVFLVGRFPLVARIRFGYAVMVPVLVAVPCMQLVYDRAPNGYATSYALVVALAGVAGIGCGVQQGSFYGYSGMFPPVYTQALMTGEAIAGVLVSVNRIFTKAVYSGPSASAPEQLAASTALYFGISAAVLVACAVVHEITLTLPFSVLHTASAARGIEMPGTKRPAAAGRTTTMDFAAPVQLRPQVGLVAAHGEDDGDALHEHEHEAEPARPRARLVDVVGKVASPALLVFANFFVTLSAYPGLATSATSVGLGEWYPVLLVATFNLSDFVSRLPTARMPTPPLQTLTWQTLARVLLLPLVCVLASPATAPRAAGTEVLMFALLLLLGTSNGYLSALLMMHGPTLASAIESELAGNVMATALLSGLAFGSLFALLLGWLIL